MLDHTPTLNQKRLWYSDEDNAINDAETRIEILRDRGADVAVLYSGGLDSLALAMLLPEAQLHMMGKRSTAKDDPDIKPRIKQMNVQFPDAPSTTTIQWGRNTLYATVSAGFADIVVLGGNASDTGSDKDPEWANRLNAVFEYTCQYPNMRDGRASFGNPFPRVGIPLSMLTKTQILELVRRSFVQSGVDRIFTNSTSCENEGDVVRLPMGSPRKTRTVHQCGDCLGCYWKACVFRKFDSELYDANWRMAFPMNPLHISADLREAYIGRITKYRWSPAIEEITQYY